MIDPFSYRKRKADVIQRGGMSLGWNEPVRVVLPAASCAALDAAKMGDFMPEISCEDAAAVELDPRDAAACAALQDAPATLVTVKDGVDMPPVQAFRLLAAVIPTRHSILLKDTLGGESALSAPMAAGVNIGSLLCDGIETPSASAWRKTRKRPRASPSTCFRLPVCA